MKQREIFGKILKHFKISEGQNNGKQFELPGIFNILRIQEKHAIFGSKLNTVKICLSVLIQCNTNITNNSKFDDKMDH